MTIPRLVDVAIITAQAVIDAAAATEGDADCALLRVAVLELLRMQAHGQEADGDDAQLLDAYRNWLDVAVALYSTGNEALVEDYARRVTALQVEMEKAETRAYKGDDAS